MLQLKLGLSLATDLSFTRTNKVIECLDLVDKCIKGIRALSLYFSWSRSKNEAKSHFTTCNSSVPKWSRFYLTSVRNQPCFGKKGLRMAWFSTKKEKHLLSYYRDSKPPWPLHAYWTPLYFNVPPRKWQLRVYNSCVLKSGTKMRLLSNSPVQDTDHSGANIYAFIN